MNKYEYFQTSTYAMKVGLFIGLCVFIALTSSVHFIGKGSVVTVSIPYKLFFGAFFSFFPQTDERRRQGD